MSTAQQVEDAQRTKSIEKSRIQLLGSDRPEGVADQLSNEFIDRLRQDPRYSKITDQLVQVRDKIWAPTVPKTRDYDETIRDRRDTFTKILNSFESDEDRTRFMEAYAKLGHLHEMASLLARQNFLTAIDATQSGRPEGSAPIDGHGVEAYILGGNGKPQFETPSAAVEQLNKPVFEATFTAHPTNNNTSEIMAALRNIGEASTQLVHYSHELPPKGNPDALKHHNLLIQSSNAALAKSMDDFINVPPVPVDAQGKDKNFTVYDETRQMLTFLSAVYKDLPGTYDKFDEALQQKEKQAEKDKQAGKLDQSANTGYDPLALKLDIRFNSWGSSGDKDGNKSVNADTTLEAAYEHTLEAVQHYKRDLNQLGLSSMRKWANPAAVNRLERLEKKLKVQFENLQGYAGYLSAAREQNEAETDPKNKKALTSKEFGTYSRKLAELTPDTDAIEKAAISLYKQLKPIKESTDPELQNKREVQLEAKHELLNFIRRVHTFGAHMGKLEYRETSEEFGRVIGLMDAGYGKLVTENKELLEKLDENKVQKSIGGKATLSEEEERGIHARLRAIEQERSKILTNLLESGKGPELLKAVRGRIEKEGQGHNFDDSPYKKDEAIAYHTLKRLELVRDNPGLATSHVLAECQGLSNKLELQLLMEAVSTPKKKLTMGIIPLYEDPDVMQRIKEIELASYKNTQYFRHLQEVAQAHKEETLDGKGAITQQVQLAHSDNRRRGGPAAAVGYIDEGHRKVREAGQEAGVAVRFYEGGSLSDAFRNGVRAISAMVNEFGLADYTKQTFQGIDLHNYFGLAHSTERLLSRGIMHGAKHFDDPVPGKLEDDPFNLLAVKALQNTYKDYESEIFQTNKIGVFIAGTGFGGSQELKAGSVGSRGQRKQDDIFKPVEVDYSAASGKSGKLEIKAVNPDKIRTINFSELLAHSGINPTWLGTGKLRERIRDTIVGKEDAAHPGEWIVKPLGDEIIAAAQKKIEGATTRQQKKPYEDLVIQVTNVRRNQDAEVPAELTNMLYTKSPAFREVIDRMNYGIAMSNLDTMAKLHPRLADTQAMETLKKEYADAGRLVLAATSGSDISIRKRVGRDEGPNDVRQAVTKSAAMIRLEPTIVRKRSYMEFVNFFKQNWLARNGADKAVPDHVLRVTHDALDTALYGRMPLADDPRYAELSSQTSLSGSTPNVLGNGASKGGHAH